MMLPMEDTKPLSFYPSRFILVVEDDILTAELLQQVIFEETPFHVRVANHPVEALKIAKTVRFNLFIIDYLLPFMDGLQLYDALHAIEELKNTPALITSTCLTLQKQRGIKERKLIAMEKPFELDELLVAIGQTIA